MATYIKGDAVTNATSYELYEKTGSSTYNFLGTAAEINFNLDSLSLASGAHVLVVKAKASGYTDSDYSNEVTYTVNESGSGIPVPVTFYDYSNGNDWFVMYSKEDKANGVTPIRYGLNTSNSMKAKNYVCALEDGETYTITFKNKTAGTYRCRMVTFAETFGNITRSALSMDANTGTTTTNVVEYDWDNTTYQKSIVFTNSLNHKTLAMTLGWTAEGQGAADIEVSVVKGNAVVDLGSELIVGLNTGRDIMLGQRTTTTGEAAYIPILSNTGKSRIYLCEIENGATYNYSYSNKDASSTYRSVVCTYAPSLSELKIAPLGFSTSDTVDPAIYSCPVDTIHAAAKETEGSYSGTFTNTNNAKTLAIFVGWGADATKITASVKKA